MNAIEYAVIANKIVKESSPEVPECASDLKPSIYVKGDGVYSFTPINDKIGQERLVMDKETFIECYHRWILNES